MSVSSGAAELRAFECTVPGKWVLAGEHSVLRGATAVAMPHPSASLTLRFAPDPSLGRLIVEPVSAQRIIDEILLSLSNGVVAGGLRIPSGRLRLESTIPVGAGLGSSAALCVAITRWVAPALGLPQDEWFGFARRLEDRFHGRSSGMDVAATSSGEAIRFSMEEGPSPIGVRRLPMFTFHDTRERARTSDCIQRVQAYLASAPVESAETDQRMNAAGREATQGLIAYDRGLTEEGLTHLARAMDLAQDCYRRWGLLPARAETIESELRAQGALAVKLTGAGGGGFLVALWKAP